MNKTELTRVIAEKTGMTKKDAGAVLDVLPDIIKEIVANGDKVAITGFITFEKKDIKEKTGTVRLGENKGSAWTSPAHSEIKVKLSKAYRML